MGHSGTQGDGKFIAYNENNNSWTVLHTADVFYHDHGYDQTTIDPNTGVVYRRVNMSDRIAKYVNSSWSTVSAGELGTTGSIASALEYFPELNGLVFVDSYIGAMLYNTKSGKWSTLIGNPDMGDYHNFAEYSPVHKVVIFGGGNGSNSVYRVNADGSVNRMNNAPVNLGIAWGSIVSVDPIGGDFLVWASTGTFYSYDPRGQGKWTDHGRPTHPYDMATPSYGSNIFGIVAAPMAIHGAVMLLGWNNGSPKAYLYRHSAGNGTPPDPMAGPPSPPKNLRVIAVQ
jgi:hypothetical protein